MRIYLNIHNRSHLLKNILGHMEFSLTKGGLKAHELTVVNYHGTPQQFIPNFKKQLSFFSQNFHIITPQQLPEFYAGKLMDIEKPLLLLTFDDGIKNNLYAADLLNQHNLKAFFFVVPAFIDTAADEQKKYFIKNIRPLINPAIDNLSEDFTAMNWEELKMLQEQGHVIGSHTQTHTLVMLHSSAENSSLEIKESKNTIAEKLNMQVSSINAFCSINNTLKSVGLKELQLIRENYKYHFTTLPGVNKSSSDPLFIKRSNIESHWLAGAVKYAVGTWDVKRWQRPVADYNALLNQL